MMMRHTRMHAGCGAQGSMHYALAWAQEEHVIMQQDRCLTCAVRPYLPW